MNSACFLDITALSNHAFVDEAERLVLYRELERPIWQVLVWVFKEMLRAGNLTRPTDLSLKVRRTTVMLALERMIFTMR
jgi:hypothetical protein